MTSTNRLRLHDPTYYSRGREVHLLLLHPIGRGYRLIYISQRRSSGNRFPLPVRLKRTGTYIEFSAEISR